MRSEAPLSDATGIRNAILKSPPLAIPNRGLLAPQTPAFHTHMDGKRGPEIGPPGGPKSRPPGAPRPAFRTPTDEKRGPENGPPGGPKSGLPGGPRPLPRGLDFGPPGGPDWGRKRTIKLMRP